MAKVLVASVAASSLFLSTSQPISSTTTIEVDWSSSPLRSLRTTPAFQTVVNPLTTRQSPTHDAVYNSIAALGADYQRYVPWLPYPKLGVAALEPPSYGVLCGFVNSGGAGNPWTTTIDCGARGHGVIASVSFASYGQPTGFCGSLQRSATCDAPGAAGVVAAACVGKSSCTLTSNDATFGPTACGASARLAVEVTCSAAPANAVYTYWDFALLDAGMSDFLNAAGVPQAPNASSAAAAAPAAAPQKPRIAVPNFSTIPAWLFNGSTRVLYPDDPLGETWDYEGPEGNTFRDPSLTELGDYYGRLVAHYTEGGFTDEAGVFIPGYRYDLSNSIWEVLNEPEGEHFGGNPAGYTAAYDAIVAGVKKWAPNAWNAGLRFMGLALENSGNVGWVQYFLNRTNHADRPGLPAADVPLDAVSFHHYAQPGSRNDTAAYETMFSSADAWLVQVAAIIAARDALSPNTLLDADEVGVILPNDNSAQYTAQDPGFGPIYWNAAAASYAYLFGTTSVLGLDILGESQLVGYPQLSFNRTDAPYDNSPWTAPPQYPSVSLLYWDGTGTARYWALKLLLDEMKPGAPSGRLDPSLADAVMNTTAVGSGATLPDGSFCGSVLNLLNLTLACDAPGAVISTVSFADYGTPSGSCGAYAPNPACTEEDAKAVVEGYCLGKATCTVPAGPPAWGDPCYGTVKTLTVQAKCSSGTGRQVGAAAPVYGQGYREASGGRKVLIVNKSSQPQNVTVAGAGGGAVWRYIDLSTGFGPAGNATLGSDTWTLQPFSLGVLRLPATAKA